jgi:two-component system cell cycle response regulator
VSGARIVVVDDNDENRRFITFLVEAFGHTAVALASGEEAVEVVPRERPDLVLLDIQMPGMDGFDTLRELRANPDASGIPVVALTALAMVGDREAGLAAGFDGYVTKPVQPERFAGDIDPFLPPDRRSRLHRTGRIIDDDRNGS